MTLTVQARSYKVNKLLAKINDPFFKDQVEFSTRIYTETNEPYMVIGFTILDHQKDKVKKILEDMDIFDHITIFKS